MRAARQRRSRRCTRCTGRHRSSYRALSRTRSPTVRRRLCRSARCRRRARSAEASPSRSCRFGSSRQCRARQARPSGSIARHAVDSRSHRGSAQPRPRTLPSVAGKCRPACRLHHHCRPCSGRRPSRRLRLRLLRRQLRRRPGSRLRLRRSRRRRSRSQRRTRLRFHKFCRLCNPSRFCTAGPRHPSRPHSKAPNRPAQLLAWEARTRAAVVRRISCAGPAQNLR